MRNSSFFAAGVAFCVFVFSVSAEDGRLPAVWNHISAAELKGDLSFLASDALQGRYTPSPGLEVAAEFIASKFRAAGLDPGGDQDYFQTATMVDRHMPPAVSALTIDSGTKSVTVPAASLVIEDTSRAEKLERAPVLVFTSKDDSKLKGLDLKGKAVVVLPGGEGDWQKARAFNRALAKSDAAVEITFVKHLDHETNARLLFERQAGERRVPRISIESKELAEFIGNAAQSDLTVSLDVPAPQDVRAVVKNVVGILRGSDPALKDTCVLLTAHYDHIGTVDTAGRMAVNKLKDSADRIYNGANDDGSGTVSVIEIAQALAKISPHPKRSIVFMTFFGEERGELGSQYYGAHPVFPIGKTVADINLEQVGRTDSTTGEQKNNASITGFDYSDVTGYLERAGKQTGITIYKDPVASDEYFTRSDNDALAEQGVPAHSLCVAFDYPDYHGIADEWQKINYENMAKVDRMIALAVLNIADSLKPPAWNVNNPKTKPFRAAQEKARGQEKTGTQDAAGSYQ